MRKLIRKWLGVEALENKIVHLQGKLRLLDRRLEACEYDLAVRPGAMHSWKEIDANKEPTEEDLRQGVMQDIPVEPSGNEVTITQEEYDAITSR